MKQFGTAAILAGGKSTRMGFDKQLLTLQEKRIYEYVKESLREIFDDFLIVTNTPEMYEKIDVRVCKDVFKDMGPLSGIHAALLHSRSEYVYVIACDMPIVCREFVKYIKFQTEKTNSDICLAEKDGKIEPFNAIYSRRLISCAEEMLSEGNTSLFKFIKNADTLILPEQTARKFDPNLKMYTNLNTNAEYLKYIQSK